MDLREFFLYLHDATHFTGKAAWTLDAAMVPHYRTVLPEHNSVAWNLWHIARGEDWAIQTILQGVSSCSPVRAGTLGWRLPIRDSEAA
jgi:hypothetical protein